MSKMDFPTGHEYVFNPPHMAIKQYDFDPEVPGESSWMGAGVLDELDMPVVHLVRNPIHTLRSLVGIWWLSGRHPSGLRAKYENYAMTRLGSPSYDASDDRQVIIKRNVAFMWKWTIMIEQHDTLLVRVEDLSRKPSVAYEMIDYLVDEDVEGRDLPRMLTTNVNHRPRDEGVTWNDAGWKLAELAEKWGYHVG